MERMSVYDLKSEQEWQAILDEISKRLGMPAALMDEKNVILQHSGTRNDLCLAVRGNDHSRSTICGASQQFLAQQAWSSGEPVIDVCEAGICKFVLPLGGPDRPVGTLTACGSCSRTEDIEDEMVQLNLPMEDEALASLKAQVPTLQVEDMKAYVDDLFRRIRAA